MMQAADLWDLDALAKPGRLDQPADRRILFERQGSASPEQYQRRTIEAIEEILIF